MKVILHLRQNIIIIICGLDPGCEILLHCRLRGEWNVISHLETQVWKNDQLFKTKLLPLLKIKKLKERGKLLNFILYLAFILLSKLPHVLLHVLFQDISVPISQCPHFFPLLFLFGKGDQQYQLTFEK